MEKTQKLIALTNQKFGRIDVHDISKGSIDSDSLIWSRTYPWECIAGVKLRIYKGRRVVIATFGSYFANMVDYESEEELWATSDSGKNPHSIELIPFDSGEYLIAVAGSESEQVRFYDPEDKSGSVITSVPCPDGHGVLYDPENKCLWKWGRDLLEKCRVSKNGSDVKVEILESYICENRGGHDMAPVYGDKNRIWLTANRKVYQFDKTTGEFLSDFPACELLHSPERDGQVKGIGSFNDGTVVKLYPDGKHFQWTGQTIRVMTPDGKGGYDKTAITSNEDGHYYKVRVFCEDYQ